ncbi:MAG TPA: permease-like cell division protein FtsX [Melioribacteraceae bacterium]|nr:permease-like cell division protein FtsX [Melioribacteraceae bacterium]
MIIFYLKETLKIFRRSSIATIITITITTIAILLSSLSVFLIFLSRDFSDRVKQNIEVNLYLNDPISSNDIEQVKEELKAKGFIYSSKFISKDEAAREFIRETGEDFRAVLQENPLPNSFTIKFKPDMVTEKNFDGLVDELKRLPGVSDVVYDFNLVVRILKVFRSIEYVVYLASILLIFLSVYLVYSNNRLQYESNKNLYRTMKLVGAKLPAIKIPIILYSVLIGLFSSFICFLINYIILNMLTAINISLKFSLAFGAIHIITFVMGLLLGLLGSYFASNRISLKISDTN